MRQLQEWDLKHSALQRKATKSAVIVLFVFSFISFFLNTAEAVTPKIAAGSAYTLMVKSDGTLWAWGHNGLGSLGDGTTTDRHSPKQIGTDTKWVSIGAKAGNSIALKSDGTLWTWGSMKDSTTSVTTPVQNGADNNWASVAAGYFHRVALKSDGTLWTWGYNDHGQLGDGTTTSSPHHQIGTDANWVSIAAGGDHTAAVKSDGTLWTWGWNYWGQLGDSTWTQRTIPVRIGADTNWVSAAAGASHTVALKSSGSLWAWGFNGSGVIGDGTTTHRNSPVQIGTDVNWVSIAAGGNHTVAVKSDGTLWAWGENNYGQLGDGTTTNKYSPVRIGTATNWSSVAAGTYHTVALKSDGTLWAWGWNTYGQLGDGTTTNRYSPVQIITYIITPSAGANGSISPNTPQTVVHNSITSFTVTPNYRYYIASVIGCGGTLSGNTYTTGPITGDCTVSATFAPGYIVTPSAATNGSINPNTAQTVAPNGTTSFTVTPNTGYHIASVTGCGGTLSGNTYATGLITSDCTVSATFAINTYTVTPSAGINGSISPNAPQGVIYDGTTSFTVTPNTGYRIALVTGCGGGLSGNTYSTGPITGDCIVSATFAPGYIVTPSAGLHGSISPNTSQIVDYNGTTSFTVTPDSGYYINSVTGCGGTLSGNTYTTGPITGDCTVTAYFYTGRPTIYSTGTSSPAKPTSDINIWGSSSQYTFWKREIPNYLTAAGCTLTGSGETADKKHFIQQANCGGATKYFRVSSKASYDGPLAVDGNTTHPSRDTACSVVGANYRPMISISDCSGGTCSNPAAPGDCYPVTLGPSDVVVTDFFVQYSQGALKGPLGGTYTIRNFPANPFALSANTTNFCRPLAIPFSFFVNNTVKKTDGTTITNISTAEAKMIFSGVVKDWSDLSAVSMNSRPVAVCMRHAGSGTHAAMDAFMRPQTVLKVAVGTATSTGYKVFFNDGGSDLLRCVNGSGSWTGAGAIGYANADQELSGYPNTTRIALNGIQPVTANVYDYSYPFVSIQNLYVRTADVSNSVLNDLCTYAGQPSLVHFNNDSWSATCDMRFIKDSIFGNYLMNADYHNANCN